VCHRRDPALHTTTHAGMLPGQYSHLATTQSRQQDIAIVDGDVSEGVSYEY
jgi:hypothetical protein